MKYLFCLLFAFLSTAASGQAFNSADEAGKIFKTLVEQKILDKAILDYAVQLSAYHFDGDYSRESVFPNLPPTSTISVAPITFKESIHAVLSGIDPVYDSAFYQNQLQDYRLLKWSDQEMNISPKRVFVRSRIGRFLAGEVGHLTYPIFSRDGKTAFLSYRTVNRNSVIKKQDKIYILRKEEQGWEIVDTIDSIKMW